MTVDAPVQLTRKDGVGLVTVDNPPVNALSQAVRRGLIECMDAALAADDIRAIILACAGRTFIAGADISEFNKPPMEPHLPDVLRRLDESPKPVVALHGTVLGGGFETALACHYRVAKRGTRMGLPEVTLGLIPGAGGTQRLPRIVGVETALEMITSGRPRPVEELLEHHGVDAITDGDVLEAARNFAARLLASPQPKTLRIAERPVQEPPEHDAFFAGWRRRMEKKYRGQESPLRAIDAVENAVRLPFEEGLRKEREIFLQCRASGQARALRHAFFAERQASRTEGLDGKGEPVEVSTVGVVGAGTMGTGIAMCFANASVPVTLVENRSDNLDRGLTAIAGRYEKSVSQGRIDGDQAAQRRGLIRGSGDFGALQEVDLVIEAAFENLEVKREIFARLDQVCNDHAILATNTSYLDIDRIADAVAQPQRVVGMHFFSPADVMKLLEVVRAGRTDDRAVKTAMDVGRRIGKIPVPVGLCYGFAGNRMYAAYGREGQMLLLQGASPREIDAAMQAFGMAMGPMAVLDMSGLDISYKARREHPLRPDDPLFFRPADVLVEAGRLGRKTGRGFYLYDPDSGERRDDPEVTDIIRREAGALGVEQRQIGEEEVRERMLYALINEGAKILDEGIARCAADLDVIWLNGYGFPRYRGGPMFYAADIGLQKVLDGVNTFRERYGDRYWRPATLLEQSAARGEWLKR